MSEAVAGAVYVVGFMFDKIQQNVLLINKTHPEWQRGKINGVGGRVEDESPLEAMRREFAEEVGIEHREWHQFCSLSDARHWAIHFFFGIGPIWDARMMTDESPVIYPVRELPDNVIPNLRWLIPMALSMEHESVDGFDIKEVKSTVAVESSNGKEGC